MKLNDRGSAVIVVAALLVALAGAGVVAGTMAADTPDGDEVLNDTRDRYAAAETVVVDAEVTAENRTTGETVTRSVSLVAAEDNRSRVTVDGENRSLVAGSNGTAAWRHDPATGVTVIADEDGVRAVGPIGDALPAGENASPAWNGTNADWNETDWSHDAEGADRENVSVERVETTTRDGVEVHVLSITRDDADGELRLWVTTESNVVVWSRLQTPNATVTANVTETAFNASVADSTFEPPNADGPAGAVEPVDDRDALGDALASPLATLPTDAADIAFERGVVSQLNGETVAVSRYEVGGDAVTVLQSADGALPPAAENGTTVTVGDQTATVSTDRGRTVVWWTQDGTTVAVVADADVDRVVTIAERIQTEG